MSKPTEPSDELTISEALAGYGVRHEKGSGYLDRRHIFLGDKPLGLMNAFEAGELVELLRSVGGKF